MLPVCVMVELQAVSLEFYCYMKSMQFYRIIQNDKNVESIQIYSNEQKGGIMSTLNYNRHFEEFGEFSLYLSFCLLYWRQGRFVGQCRQWMEVRTEDILDCLFIIFLYEILEYKGERI